MRIVVVCPDLPFPPNAGHRLDYWRKILAYHRVGAEVFLLVRFPDDSSSEDLDKNRSALSGFVDELRFFGSDRGGAGLVRSLLRVVWGVPWHAARRTPPAAEARRLIGDVLEWRPDAVFSEGLWCGALAERIAKEAAVPLIYRSHNIEHRYMASQAVTAMTLRNKLVLGLGCFQLRRFERHLFSVAKLVLDISFDDVQFWRGEGFKNVDWLPPIASPAAGECVEAKDIDVLFLGNLATPNNVAGVKWLVEEVLPHLRAAVAGVRIVIAGSAPVAAVVECCEAGGVELLKDVPDAAALYARSRVLVNPVMTGSGVQMKALEMLMTDAWIVSSPQGVRGLPAEVREQFRVCDSAPTFAEAIVAGLQSGGVDSAARAASRSHFGIEPLRAALNKAVTSELPFIGARTPREAA